jgi:hypothetical protein
MNLSPSRSLRGFAASLLLLALAGLGSGCVAIVAAGAGAGTVAYLRGELEATLGGNLERTNQAVGKAVQELKFVRISESKDALLVLTVVRNAADQRIEIRQEVLGEKLTRVRIRVGVFGDERLSRTLLERIQAAL